ncbi:YciI family protein [Cellulomonas sp. S1-8]|uniref:YciI family protein n=1 Tax=Cellulomonas sp. S1-8 TaxID=2904790 RepID=UPI0022445281|nr:YciI family protein [Cellulomonas sp. S1-8]UZN03614.1 YciI family protein [Cellulomonas sp. S1-8]
MTTTTTPTYALLLWGDPDACEDLEAAFAEHGKFTEACAANGHEIVGGEELSGAATARLLRVTENGPEVTDGPYAETTEQLGGFYLIRTADPDGLLRLAAPLVMDDGGTLELRPVAVYDAAAHTGAA